MTSANSIAGVSSGQAPQSFFASGNVPERATPPGNLPHRDLVKRARAGDSRAFSQLASLHSPQLLAAALRIVSSRQDAEDVVQLALFKAFRKLHQYRGEAAFSTWLGRITINEAHGLLRRRRLDPVAIAGSTGTRYAVFPSRPAPNPTPEEQCLYEEKWDLLQDCIEKIGPGCRAVLRRALEGHSYEEIAQQLGITTAAVKSRVLRGRRAMTGMIARRGFGNGRSSLGHIGSAGVRNRQ